MIITRKNSKKKDDQTLWNPATGKWYKQSAYPRIIRDVKTEIYKFDNGLPYNLYLQDDMEVKDLQDNIRMFVETRLKAPVKEPPQESPKEPTDKYDRYLSFMEKYGSDLKKLQARTSIGSIILCRFIYKSDTAVNKYIDPELLEFILNSCPKIKRLTIGKGYELSEITNLKFIESISSRTDSLIKVSKNPNCTFLGIQSINLEIIEKIPKLQMLYLYVPCQLETISGFKNLTVLKIRKFEAPTKFTTKDLKTIKNLPKLRDLEINYFKPNKDTPINLGNLPSLSTLELFNVKINKVYNIPYIKEFKRVDMLHLALKNQMIIPDTTVIEHIKQQQDTERFRMFNKILNKDAFSVITKFL